MTTAKPVPSSQSLEHYDREYEDVKLTAHQKSEKCYLKANCIFDIDSSVLPAGLEKTNASGYFFNSRQNVTRSQISNLLILKADGEHFPFPTESLERM